MELKLPGSHVRWINWGWVSVTRGEWVHRCSWGKKTQNNQKQQQQQQQLTHLWAKCVSLGSLAFRTLLIEVLKRGPTATGPCGTLFQDSDNLNDGGKAEEMWSGVCNWGITGKLVEEFKVELDRGCGCMIFWWDIEPNTLRTVLIFPEIFFKDFVNSGGTVGWSSDKGRHNKKV